MIKGSGAEGAGGEQGARGRGQRSAALRASRRVRGVASGATEGIVSGDNDGGYYTLGAPRKRARREEGAEDDDNIGDHSPYGAANAATAAAADDGGPEDAKGGGRLERRRRQLREASRRFRQKQRDTISTLNDEVADMRRVVFALSQELERHSIPIPRAAKSVVSRELAHHAATDNFVRVFAHASSSTPDSNPSSDTVSRASGSSAAHAGAAKPMHTDVSPTTEARSARQSLRRSSRSSTSSRVPLERFAHAPYGATRHPHAAVHHPHAGSTPAQGAASVPRHMMYAAPAPSRPGEGQPCARPRPVHSGRSMPGHSARTQRQGAVAKECVYSAPPQTGMAYPQGAMQFPGMPYPGFWGMLPAMQGFGQGQAAAIAAAAAAGDSRAVAAMEGRIPIATDSSHMMYPGQMAPYWGLEQQAASQKAAGLAQGPAGMPFPTASACQDADSYCIPPGMSAAAEPAGLDEGAGEGEERQ